MRRRTANFLFAMATTATRGHRHPHHTTQAELATRMVEQQRRSAYGPFASVRYAREDMQLRAWASGGKSWRCGSCGAWIEKNQGCNHMTCKQCKHEFCKLPVYSVGSVGCQLAHSIERIALRTCTRTHSHTHTRTHAHTHTRTYTCTYAQTRSDTHAHLVSLLRPASPRLASPRHAAPRRASSFLTRVVLWPELPVQRGPARAS